MADTVEAPAKDAKTGPDLTALAVKWQKELDQANRSKKLQAWRTRGMKIVKRYRDDRGNDTGGGTLEDGVSDKVVKFNILWSNINTLMPALYARVPKPIVERRYHDRDPVGRAASTILERTISVKGIDEGGFHQAMRRVVLDRLLPGRGTMWARYEPRYDGPDQQTASVADESVCFDYVDWRDFLCEGMRTWPEVGWIARRSYLTREQGVKRFGKKFEGVPLAALPSDEGNKDSSGANDAPQVAAIWEIWDKRKRQVVFKAEKYETEVLEVADDPLHLDGFWPTAEPLSATLTNDTLVPVPDYAEYQGQAQELDLLTARIAALTECIKVAGVYDASVTALRRIFTEATENELIPVGNWAMLSEKGGLAQGIQLVPLKELAAALLTLYDARDRVKADLYEISGISDIIRGQGAAGETATAQRIKGQFATLRLQDLQGEVARYARDMIRIGGEIIAEHFSPETLLLASDWKEYAQEQFPPEPVPQPPQQPMGPPPGQPGMGGPPGVPPGAGGPPQQGMGMPQPDPAQAQQMAQMLYQQAQQASQMAAQQKSQQVFMEAVKLLKDDRLRGFRVDIETDSIIEPDLQMMQQSRTEFLAATGQFLAQAVPLAQVQPEAIPLLGKMLLFGVRGFRAGRDLETAFEEYLSKAEMAAKNPQPKPPSPEEIKAKSEADKAQAALQQTQVDAQAHQQQVQMDLAAHGQEVQMDMAERQQEAQLSQAEHTQRLEEIDARSAAVEAAAKAKAQAAKKDGA